MSDPSHDSTLAPTTGKADSHTFRKSNDRATGYLKAKAQDDGLRFLSSYRLAQAAVKQYAIYTKDWNRNDYDEHMKRYWNSANPASTGLPSRNEWEKHAAKNSQSNAGGTVLDKLSKIESFQQTFDPLEYFPIDDRQNAEGDTEPFTTRNGKQGFDVHLMSMTSQERKGLRRDIEGHFEVLAYAQMYGV
ncbi:hypothetical protein V866_005687 [Kwoniella sp. B9012]